MTAAAQHRFCALLKEVEFELAAHWNDPYRARRFVDNLSDLASDMVKEELEEWYGTDF